MCVQKLKIKIRNMIEISIYHKLFINQKFHFQHHKMCAQQSFPSGFQNSHRNVPLIKEIRLCVTFEMHKKPKEKMSKQTKEFMNIMEISILFWLLISSQISVVLCLKTYFAYFENDTKIVMLCNAFNFCLIIYKFSVQTDLYQW